RHLNTIRLRLLLGNRFFLRAESGLAKTSSVKSGVAHGRVVRYTLFGCSGLARGAAPGAATALSNTRLLPCEAIPSGSARTARVFAVPQPLSAARARGNCSAAGGPAGFHAQQLLPAICFFPPANHKPWARLPFVPGSQSPGLCARCLPIKSSCGPSIQPI